MRNVLSNHTIRHQFESLINETLLGLNTIVRAETDGIRQSARELHSGSNPRKGRE